MLRFRKVPLQEPELFPYAPKEVAQPMEPRLHEILDTLTPVIMPSTQQFTEELAILKRWFYRTHKLGEVVFAKSSGELPGRKIANAVGRVHRGEKAIEAINNGGAQAPPPAVMDRYGTCAPRALFG